jgi:hypothetical protein
MTTNVDMFDRYSVPHAAVGAVFAASGIPALWAIGSHVLFEAAEDKIKEATTSLWPAATPDTMINHVGDLVSFSGGYFLTEGVRQRPGGRELVTALVALGAGIWAWNLLHIREFGHD